ncbi:MAG: intracellular septation protein [Rhizobiales bacterium 65-79]|jgi:intracellular septation protein A|nr:septation protein IspZ [Hyphomicrobiales bacterium]OJU04110.1 MAG: intracellular septation protein [Rhizobiales bacterium 65-79]
MKQFLYAVRPLVFDALGVIVFAVLVALKVDFIIAAVAGAAVAAAIVLWEIVRGRSVPPLQWISLALVLLSTAATYLTNDPRFVMAKPSVVYLVVGAVMLKRGWMNRYVPPASLPLIEDRMTFFGYVWAGLMFLTAVLNLVVAVWFTGDWPAFIGFFPLASKIALFLLQFATIKATARRRLAAGADAAPPASARGSQA